MKTTTKKDVSTTKSRYDKKAYETGKAEAKKRIDNIKWMLDPNKKVSTPKIEKEMRELAAHHKEGMKRSIVFHDKRKKDKNGSLGARSNAAGFLVVAKKYIKSENAKKGK